jgi:hypothetical protein
MTAEEMMGADRRAQALGTPGRVLMERDGPPQPSRSRSRRDGARPGACPRLGGPNNGGDVVPAFNRRADGSPGHRGPRRAGGRPTPDGAANWARLEHESASRSSMCLRCDRGPEPGRARATDAPRHGVAGGLREPSARRALCRAARAAGPGLAIDAPTAVDLTSGGTVRPGRPGGRDDHLPSAEDRLLSAAESRSLDACWWR